MPIHLDAMIASTERGIWVNRLSNVTIMNGKTKSLTGTTRDGTFLIENGKITKANRRSLRGGAADEAIGSGMHHLCHDGKHA